MNILITGAFGFIGSNIAQNLQHEHTIYACDIPSMQNISNHTAANISI